MINSNTVLTPSSLPSIQIIDGTSYCSSLEVAEHFEKQHKHVIRDIEENITQVTETCYKPKSGLIANLFKKSDYEITTGVGTKVKKPMYLLNKDGFTLLAMGYTGSKAMKFKLAYIEAFNKMEKKLNARPHTCLAPLTENHQSKLSEAVDERVKQSGISRGELLSKLRSHYEVSSWKKIHDSEYYNALALVRTWVFLENESSNNGMIKLTQLSNYAKNELGFPDLRELKTSTARDLILNQTNTTKDDHHDRAGFIAMRMEWVKALVMASEIGYENISRKAKGDYALAVKSLAFDIHCAVNELAKI